MPQVSVVVRAPAAAAVVGVGCFGAVEAEILDEIEQHRSAFGQVAGLRGPVVHLGVGVDGVIAAPGRSEAIIPKALQVGGQRMGTGAGNQQISSVLEEQRYQGWIRSR